MRGVRQVSPNLLKPWRTAVHAPRGDTLVEVLLSISVLGLVLVLSFTAASRSLNAGTDAANRNQALAYARQQVELLREAANNNTITSFPTDGTTFCIDPSSDQETTPSHQNPDSQSDGFCHFSGQAPFGVIVKFNPANQTYDVTSQWQGRTNLQSVVLYYQVPLGPIAAPPFSGSGGSGQPPVPAPKITIDAVPTQVASGGNSQINWTASNASQCYPSAGPSDWMANSDRRTTGSFDASAISSDTTYTITCDSNSGGPSSQASTTVTVAAAPSVKLSASSTSIEYYQNISLSWQVSGVSACSASSNDGSWGGVIAPSNGSTDLNHLSSGTKKYTLTCNSSAGPKSDSVTVFVNNSPGFCIDANFQNCTYFKSDVSNLNDYGLNDTISSVLVPPGRREILYKDANFGGACYVAASNVTNMGNTSVGNDELSSFKNSTSGGC